MPIPVLIFDANTGEIVGCHQAYGIETVEDMLAFQQLDAEDFDGIEDSTFEITNKEIDLITRSKRDVVVDEE